MSSRESGQCKGPVAECASFKQHGEWQQGERLEHRGERSEEASCQPW